MQIVGCQIDYSSFCRTLQHNILDDPFGYSSPPADPLLSTQRIIVSVKESASGACRYGLASCRHGTTHRDTPFYLHSRGAGAMDFTLSLQRVEPT